jgi:hypothetical protein
MRKPLANYRYLLPTVVNPTKSVCVKIKVPDDPAYWSAFWGALDTLAQGYRWANDEAHTAKDVVQVWRRVLDNISYCDDAVNAGIDVEECMRLRLKPDNPCIIQIECEADQWSDWYDPSNCIGGLVEQPGSGGQIAPGECKTFQVTLLANQQWRCPFPAQAGYTIHVTLASGMWNDGGEAAWHCPNGNYSILGICDGSLPTNPSDPAPALAHMRLIYSVGSTYYDGFNTTTTISGGAPPSDLTFQANDSAISNNVGSITFTVEVCAQTVSNQVVITYAQGSGPNVVNIGDEFTVTPTNHSEFGGYSQFQITFDKCCTVQWVSGNVVARATTNDFFWRGCGGSSDVYYLENGGASSINAHIGEAHRADYMSSTANQNSGPIHLKVVSVP